MVNHIRTLLLNESQATLSTKGMPYGEPWYVSPKFSGIDIPDRLLPVYRALFLDTDTVDDKAGRIDAVMSLLNAVEMRQFICVFDTRTTVDADRASFSIRELFDKSKWSSSGFEERVVDAAMSTPGLFAFTGNKDTDYVLGKLKGLAYGSFEFELKVAAIVLAYCIQLERLNNNV